MHQKKEVIKGDVVIRMVIGRIKILRETKMIKEKMTRAEHEEEKEVEIRIEVMIREIEEGAVMMEREVDEIEIKKEISLESRDKR